MRELLKLDVVMQKVSKLLKKGAKAKTVIKAITVSWTVFNVLAVIWSLIPKFDKLKEVDGEELIEAVMANQMQEPEQEIAEPAENAAQ